MKAFHAQQPTQRTEKCGGRQQRPLPNAPFALPCTALVRAHQGEGQHVHHQQHRRRKVQDCVLLHGLLLHPHNALPGMPPAILRRQRKCAPRSAMRLGIRMGMTVDPCGQRPAAHYQRRDTHGLRRNLLHRARIAPEGMCPSLPHEGTQSLHAVQRDIGIGRDGRALSQLHLMRPVHHFH